MASTGSTSTPRSLLAGIRLQDPAAWERFVRLYGPTVLAWSRRAGASMERSADVFQEVFHAVLRSVDTFGKRGPQDSFRGWLHTITRNKVRDHLRLESREPEAAGGTEGLRRLHAVPSHEATKEDPDDAVEVDLIWRALDSIRAHFKDPTWRAFWMTAVDGRAAADVAADLGLSAGAVRVARCRVLKHLREALGE